MKKPDPRLAALRPRNDSIEELRAALTRTEGAIAKAAEDLQAAAKRHGLALIVGTAEAQAKAERELEELKALGVLLLQMHSALAERLAAAQPPAPAPEDQARRLAVQAAMEFNVFWQANGEIVQRGLKLLGATTDAVALWCAAAAAAHQAAPSPPSSASVVPLRPGA